MLQAPVTQDAEQSRKIRPPTLYALIVLNDDFTPMDFVVEVLKRFIHMNSERAMATMLKIHNQGEGYCGVYTRDIGETKITHIHSYAKKHGHPLRCLLRKTQG